MQNHAIRESRCALQALKRGPLDTVIPSPSPDLSLSIIARFHLYNRHITRYENAPGPSQLRFVPVSSFAAHVHHSHDLACRPAVPPRCIPPSDIALSWVLRSTQYIEQGGGALQKKKAR